MARTTRGPMIPQQNLFTREEWNNYKRNRGLTYERYLATRTSDRQSGSWTPTKQFRQRLNRAYRARVQQTIKNLTASGDFNKDLEIPKKVRSVWWEWF